MDELSELIESTESIVRGKHATTYNLTNYETEGIDAEYSNQVLRELSNHVLEGWKDGQVNYYYFGATKELHTFAKNTIQIFELMCDKFDDDGIAAQLHVSCAFSVSDNLIGYTLSLYYPEFPKRGLYRLTYVSNIKDIATLTQTLQLAINTEFKAKSAFLSPDIDFLEP